MASNTSFESFPEEPDWIFDVDDGLKETSSAGRQTHKKHMHKLFTATKDENLTTMMIRNVPSNYSQNDLVMDMRDLGLADTYDFLYIPIDRVTGANVGYAFVNFISPAWAENCKSAFAKFYFSRRSRGKGRQAYVSVAYLQGLEKNLQHYNESRGVKDKSRRPVVVPRISSMINGNAVGLL
jgi:RNA recognition motif-containing protein